MKRIKFAIFTVFISVLISSVAFAASTNTVLTRVSGKIKCSVSLNEIPVDSVIFISAFKDGRFYSCQLKTVSSTNEVFYVDSDTDEIKIHVFKDTTSVKPLTQGENVVIKLDSITDPDWSEWV